MKYGIVLFLVVSALITKCQQGEEEPNIILVMTDDQGWFDTGFNGNRIIQTPWLDSLAASGVILDRFYSASAVCSPTRASVITGRNPVRMNIPYANEGHMLSEEITLPEILKRHGYATGHFGKWHLGTLTKTEKDANRGGKEQFIEEYTIPSEHGYEEYFCTESKVPTYDPLVFPSAFEEGESKRYGWKAVENYDEAKDYGTAYWSGPGEKVRENMKGDDSRVIMDRVLPFMKNAIEKRKPFFSTIWFHTPHLPVVSDSAHRNLYRELDLEKQIYYGTITAMDEQMGRLWKMLEENGVQDNTLIFFCSDNGPERGTPGQAGKFRDRKRSLYEGGVRVPAFAVWKKELKGGRRSFFPSVTSDYLPTIMEILSIDYPSDRPIDGVSLLSALRGDEQERAKPIGFIARPNISWVTQQYKLIGSDKREDFELYDLINDRAETNNLIEKYPEIAKNLEEDLNTWLNSVDSSKAGNDYDMVNK